MRKGVEPGEGGDGETEDGDGERREEDDKDPRSLNDGERAELIKLFEKRKQMSFDTMLQQSKKNK